MPYEYLATFERAIDGDTIVVLLDQGFGDFKRCRLRLRGINAPELHSKDPAIREQAQAAKQALSLKLAGRYPNTLRIVTRKTSKNDNSDATDVYGRYVADVYLVGNEQHVNAWMIEQRHAVPYMTD